MQSQNQMQVQSNMELFMIHKNTYMELECGICYKSVQKAYAKCSAPCNKVFHLSCMEKILDQTEEAAYEEDVEAEHKCCYCRRCIDTKHYGLQHSALILLQLKNGGYNVREAIEKVKIDIIFNDAESDYVYNYYYMKPMSYQKKPKQAKRSAPKKITKQPRIHIKQNIGGRRRS